ncbi:Clavaminate synthase-like protein [Aspergillus campestris IBT 28561]|uniref:Clavaminate synthase-like protein n=1 Tax=Aspergillus campestris (strain IBT 28561) TaxID=1392248 RepID=A0A2I1D5P4_ASPC2|nr:Clavaminate synthase-like protein [Aspergillus campestris IBT 28561]PKY05197.1 Clavaminate synthase-like protein [Aspergillus campestris IBT 28561]
MIPIVDFSSWNKPQDESDKLHVANQLVEACQAVGFVYITNHSLQESVIDGAFDWSKRLFQLPREDKMKAPHPEGWAVHRGYSWPGLEKVSQVMSTVDDEQARRKLREVPDVKEIYDIGSEHNTAQPNQWIPDECLPGFRDSMTKFYWECQRVGDEILRALAVGLNLENESYLVEKHSGHNNQLRLLHYLPVPAADLEQERTARCPAHTDWSSMTMLFQDDCGGLEVEDVSQPGTFIPVAPIKNAIVMNIGDLLQRWSNDRLRSTNHRVQAPPLADRFSGPFRMTRERFSIPYFMSPDPESVIECIPSCMDDKEGAKYEPITQAEYNEMRASMMY